MSSFTDLLAAGPAVLDGAMATELEARGVPMHESLWSAAAIDSAPEQISAVHASYLDAGARIVETDTYQASTLGLTDAGAQPAQARGLVRDAAELALLAVADWQEENPGRRALVAGSVGPFGAYLCDGSEYTGAYELTDTEYRVFHAERLHALDEAGVDVLAVETMPKLSEARAVAGLIATETSRPAWVSFQVRRGAGSLVLADGTPLAEAARWAQSTAVVEAVGVNCVAPDLVAPALKELAAHTDKPLVCYPNAGETWDAIGRRWLPTGVGVDWARLVPQWLALGAGLVGGCCRTGPEDIARIMAAMG
ncbi:homocysteine S-methyltransferase [Propionibacterium australiense]|uniref:Homocysteine S-methyltransferase n=1 Tax=Propionibacterium australiense TaxID=119981 RepID=A0A383S564_9ACTN|nr:homocysteine S-methyltransferase [Propionibacterium australiense]RLP08207.1 homocysteine S-methyltransferase [Propionibacterium australiense]RLP08265.1 homocysteine S-methyltransferase [Propionibacterium australiense]SYZ33125.1 homocysteine S-methyltransferase [Propionibacterium australiense]VEH89141.1 Homocysteine S-methyltransferase [Propionibacterium australiense]